MSQNENTTTNQPIDITKYKHKSEINHNSILTS